MQPQLIEQTAKRWKVVQIVGVVLWLLGMVALGATFMAAVEPEWAAPSAFRWAICWGLVGAGLLTIAVGRVIAWWHHG